LAWLLIGVVLRFGELSCPSEDELLLETFLCGTDIRWNGTMLKTMYRWQIVLYGGVQKAMQIAGVWLIDGDYLPASKSSPCSL
jgi:hypothetical protein